MANNCCYDMRVVGKTKESVLRMGDILGYKDSEFCLNRVFSVECCDNETTQEKEFFAATYIGDVAWSPSRWVNGEVDQDDKIDTGAHLSNLSEICNALDVGVEIWAEEIGERYQGHYAVDHNGTILVSESMEDLELRDDDDEEDTESLLKGGYENYGEFDDNASIYGD